MPASTTHFPTGIRAPKQRPGPAPTDRAAASLEQNHQENLSTLRRDPRLASTSGPVPKAGVSVLRSLSAIALSVIASVASWIPHRHGGQRRSGAICRQSARPGGNITGVSIMATDLGGKLVQLSVEIVPDRNRIGV